MLFFVPVLVFLALAALFGVRLRSGDPSRIPSALIGQAAPSFEALFRRPPPPLDLRPLLLAHLEGATG